MGSLKNLATAERRDLADYVETLTEVQWNQPSLCSEWTVRDVVGHVPSYDELGWPTTMALFARSGFSLTRANEALVERSRRLSTDELVATLRTRDVPRGITTMFGCAVALTDCMLHHQDIRRALGQPRAISEDRLAAALNFLPRARVLPAPANMRGLRLVATDIDWAYGTGPELSGTGEALLIALAGRREGLADLMGPGLSTLTQRVSAVSGSAP